MNKSYSKFFFILSLLFAVLSCKTDDNGNYVALVITTIADTGQVFQNETIDIAIFANDK